MADCVYRISGRQIDRGVRLVNLLDYLVLGGIIAAVAYIVIWLARRKKKGKNGCDGCAYRDDCVNKPRK